MFQYHVNAIKCYAGCHLNESLCIDSDKIHGEHDIYTRVNNEYKPGLLIEKGTSVLTVCKPPSCGVDESSRYHRNIWSGVRCIDSSVVEQTKKREFKSSWSIEDQLSMFVMQEMTRVWLFGEGKQYSRTRIKVFYVRCTSTSTYSCNIVFTSKNFKLRLEFLIEYDNVQALMDYSSAVGHTMTDMCENLDSETFCKFCEVKIGSVVRLNDIPSRVIKKKVLPLTPEAILMSSTKARLTSTYFTPRHSLVTPI